MELTGSFTELLHQFADVFTTPTFLTFVEIVTGWLLSHRHRFVTGSSSPAVTSATATGAGSIASSATPRGVPIISPYAWPNWSAPSCAWC